MVRRSGREATVGLLAALLATVGAPGAAVAKQTTGRSGTSGGAAVTTTATSSAAPTATTPVPSTGANPFSGGVTPLGPASASSSATATVIPNSTTTSGSSSLSSGSAIGIAVGAFIVLGGISFFIWRDARRRAPVAARSGASRGHDATEPNRPGSRAPPKARKLSAAERKRRKRGRAKR